MASSFLLPTPPHDSHSSPSPISTPTPALHPHQNSLPQEQDDLFLVLLLQQQQEREKMVRKRPASELDPQPDSPAYHHPRISRRANTSAAPIAGFVGELAAQPPLLLPTPPAIGPNGNPNPSATILTPSANPSPSSILQPLPPAPPLPPVPAVCVFSGLPLFPSEIERGSGAAPPVSSACSLPVISSSEEQGSGGPAAWVDGIIRDLIGNASTEVSIPQLIHNVREVIHPCNPGLAAVLEYRLRCLTFEQAPAALPSIPVGGAAEPSDKRRREARHELQALPTRVDYPSSALPIAVAAASQLSNWEEPNITAVQPRIANTQQQQAQAQQQPPQPQPQRRRSSATGSSEEPSSAAPVPAPSAAVREKEELRQQKRDEEGLQLLSLLLQCAEAVAADNLEEANRMLLEISELSTPFGTSAQRVAAYFSEAMTARLLSSCLGLYAPLPSAHRARLASAYQVFNGISPFVKFSHFTANQAIQEAFEREDRVHIIDLDIMQGLQWPGLFHILASRPGGPPRVRLTGLGSSMEVLEATGKRLSDFAETLGLPFEFIPVSEKVGNLDPDRLAVGHREAVAVHWLHHSLYDVTGSDTNTLWLLQR